jgi:hypothetical protein
MILHNHIRGRRRLLDEAKKARLCELIDQESYSVEQAAESLDVSLRTVQRERRHDQDFDHEVRLALQSTPDPLKLLEHAARTHWRAAAWLLERTKPEVFASKPVNMTSFKLVATALRYLQEAALETVPEEYHEALYLHTQAAIDKSLDCCFPLRGEWGEPKVKQLPFATPLTDVQSSRAWQPPTGFLPDRHEPVDPRFDDRPELYVDVEVATDLGPIEVSLPPADYRHMQETIAAAQVRAAGRAFSPTAPPSDAAILSPKTPETTKSETAKTADGFLGVDFVIATVERKLDDECPETWNDTEELDHPDAQDPKVRLRLLSERLQRHRRQERRLERAAEKKAKAAKKRAEAQRRRAA